MIGEGRGTVSYLLGPQASCTLAPAVLAEGVAAGGQAEGHQLQQPCGTSSLSGGVQAQHCGVQEQS